MVDGDATGIANAAAVGLLADNPTILYAGTLDTDPALRKATLGSAADLVITDTNRKQGFEWNSLNENTGYTETAAQPPDTSNPSDAPLNLFPKAPADAQTTAVLQGVSSVTASSYGSSITYLPEDRPANALDGNTQTGWLDDSFASQLGQWWQVVLAQPRTENSVTLLQPQTGLPDRTIARSPRAGGHLSLPDLHHAPDHRGRRGRERPRSRRLAQLGRLRRGGDPRGLGRRDHRHAPGSAPGGRDLVHR